MAGQLGRAETRVGPEQNPSGDCSSGSQWPLGAGWLSKAPAGSLPVPPCAAWWNSSDSWWRCQSCVKRHPKQMTTMLFQIIVNWQKTVSKKNHLYGSNNRYFLLLIVLIFSLLPSWQSIDLSYYYNLGCIEFSANSVSILAFWHLYKGDVHYNNPSLGSAHSCATGL